MKLLKLQNKKHKTNWIALKLMKCTAMSSLMAHNYLIAAIALRHNFAVFADMLDGSRRNKREKLPQQQCIDELLDLANAIDAIDKRAQSLP